MGIWSWLQHLCSESLNFTTFVFESSAFGSPGQPARVEYLFHPEGAALGKGALGQPGLTGSSGPRVGVALVQYRRRKRSQARAVVDDVRNPTSLPANRSDPAGRAPP